MEEIARWLRSVEPVLIPLWIRSVRATWARTAAHVPTSELRQHFFLAFFDRLVESVAQGDTRGIDAFAETTVAWAFRRGLDLPEVLALPLEMMQVLREQAAALPPREEARVWEALGPLLSNVALQIARTHTRVVAARETQEERQVSLTRQAEGLRTNLLECLQAAQGLMEAAEQGDANALWESLCHAALRLPGASRAAVWLPADGAETLRARAAQGADAGALAEAQLSLQEGDSPVVQAFRQGKARRFPARAAGEVLLVPIPEGGEECLGVLSVEFQGPDESALREAFLAALCRAAGAAWRLHALRAEYTRLQEEFQTQVAQRTQALEEMNRQLEKLARARSDFVHIAAHELKTPLTLLRGYTDILREEIQEAEQARFASVLAGIDRGLARLDRIVGNLIDMSRIETELLQLSLEPISPSSLVRLVLEETQEWVEKRRQHIVVEGVADLPPVQGDARRLHQALLNVVSNAIKFTPDGGRIAIRGRVLGAQGAVGTDFVELVVADTGIGIAKEDQERIFEKFYRVGDVQHHSSGEYKFKGAGPGLGLPIARGIIEAHGGRLWVESEGHDEERCPGSEFHIVLPVQAETLHNPPPAAPEPSGSAQEPTAGDAEGPIPAARGAEAGRSRP
ncbi:MAG: hypothetical protein H5T59_05530 [Anaerolineae bacterium]|nr:hypothetical protein [Anaerolineae bacterium]